MNEIMAKTVSPLTKLPNVLIVGVEFAKRMGFSFSFLCKRLVFDLLERHGFSCRSFFVLGPWS